MESNFWKHRAKLSLSSLNLFPSFSHGAETLSKAQQGLPRWLTSSAPPTSTRPQPSLVNIVFKRYRKWSTTGTISGALREAESLFLPPSPKHRTCKKAALTGFRGLKNKIKKDIKLGEVLWVFWGLLRRGKGSGHDEDTLNTICVCIRIYV